MSDGHFRYRAIHPAWIWVITVPILGAMGILAFEGFVAGGLGLVVGVLGVVLGLGVAWPWVGIYGYRISVAGDAVEWRAAVRRVSFPISDIAAFEGSSMGAEFRLVDGRRLRVVVRARGFRAFVGALGARAPGLGVSAEDFGDGWGLGRGFRAGG